MLLPKVVLITLVSLSLNAVALNAKSNGSKAHTGQTTAHENVVVDWSNQKVPVIRVFFRPSPDQYIAAIDAKKQIVRATLMLGDSTTVEFYERPRSIDFYDSTIVVHHQGEPPRSYNVGVLIKDQALSLAHVGLVRYGSGGGMLVCEYEGGFVGSIEGFAILRYSSSGFKLHTLKLTNFGKVVVFKSSPAKAVIWSALPYDLGADAAPMDYATQTCLWQKGGYECGPPKRQRGKRSVAWDPGIEIRP